MKIQMVCGALLASSLYCLTAIAQKYSDPSNYSACSVETTSNGQLLLLVSKPFEDDLEDYAPASSDPHAETEFNTHVNAHVPNIGMTKSTLCPRFASMRAAAEWIDSEIARAKVSKIQVIQTGWSPGSY